MHQVPLPPLYVFIRNLLYSPAYNPSIVAWVDQSVGCFKVFFLPAASRCTPKLLLKKAQWSVT